jgi:hypothetical protein
MEEIEHASDAIAEFDFRSWKEVDMTKLATLYDDCILAWIRLVSKDDKITYLGPETGFIVEKAQVLGKKERGEGKRTDRLKQCLADVTPLEIPGFTKESDYFVPIDESVIWTQPNRIEEMSEYGIARAATEMNINHIMKFPQTLASVRMASGWKKSRNHYIIRYMKKYLVDVFGGREAFVESFDRVKMTVDSCAPKRFLYLLNMYVFTIHFPEMDRVLIDSAISFIFKNPNANSIWLKSKMSVLKQSLMCMSVEGTMCKWVGGDVSIHQPHLADYMDAEIPVILMPDGKKQALDASYYKYVFDKIKEDVEDLRNNGMSVLASRMISLLSCKVVEERYREYMFYESLTAMTGFDRSEITQSHVNQIDVPKLPDDFTPYFAPELVDEWFGMMHWGARVGKIPSYETFRAQIPSFLTSKSSGGYSVRISIPIWNAKALRIQGNELILELSNKATVWSANPMKFLQFDEVVRTYSHLEPGTVGVRNVSNRPTRGIFVRRLPDFLHEIPFAITAQDYQNSRVKESIPIGSPNDFSLGMHTGNILRDHADGLLATSDPKVIIDLQDFSSFDAYQREVNARKYAREGVQKAMKLHGYDKPWGPFQGGLNELISIIWGEGKTRNAVYKSTGVRYGDKSKSVELVLDMLQSGELMTINFNNATNRANARAVLRKMTEDKIFDVLKLLKTAFMGDDSAKFWRIPTPEHMSFALQSALVDISAEVAGLNGLDLNKYKTVVRNSYYEYLKVKFVFGRMIPLLHIQLFSSENPSLNQHPVNEMVSYAGTVRTFIFRGGNEVFLHRMVHFTWRMRSNVRYALSKDRNKQFYLPMAAVWTPTRMGGVGLIPWCSVGASRDAIIAILARYNVNFKNLVERAAFVLKINTSRLAKNITDMLIEGKDTTPRNPFKGGIDETRYHMPISRVKSAIEAKRRLDSVNAPQLGNMYYVDLPHVAIAKILEGGKKLKHYDAKRKIEQGFDYEKRAKMTGTVPISKLFGWVDAIKWQDGPELNRSRKETNPLPQLRDSAYEVIKHYGLTSDPSTYASSGADFLARIRARDPLFPRHIQPEQIYGYITDPAIASNPRRVIDALVAMGARGDIAAGIASELSTKGRSFAFRQNAKGFSMNDSFLPCLDLSYSNHERVVKTFDVPDKNFEYLMYEVGFMLSIVRGYATGVFRSVVLAPEENSLGIMSRHLHGVHGHSDLIKHNDLFYNGSSVDKYGQGI